MSTLHLSADQLKVVVDILGAHLPSGSLAGVWAFGSRAGGRPRSNSDLDLLFDPPLSLTVQAKLAEAFEESSLSFTVDLVNRDELADEYRAGVDRVKIPLRR